MKAMIFAAGLGTRLKPFTLSHPKALAEVAGVPMLERVIMRLRDIGISEMVVNVHHFASQIVDFLKSNNDFGLKIHISDETSLLLDTGAGILAARKWLENDDEPFVVHNADILTDVNLAALAENHKKASATSTLLVAERDTSRYLLFDKDMRMHGWINKKTGQVRPEDLTINSLRSLAFGGVHIISPSIFPLLASYRPAFTPFSITDFYIDKCNEIKIDGWLQPSGSTWIDIGKPENLKAANAFFDTQRQ